MGEFDANKAQTLLQEVFFTKEIKDSLGLTEKQIIETVRADTIAQIQKDRLENLEVAKRLKNELEEMFKAYRFSARLKSLPSIFGKMMRNRTLADVFGIKVIIPTIKACYEFVEWLSKNYKVFDFDDRIKNPKPNGYRDLKIVIFYEDILIEFIIQTPTMYVDSHTLQKHSIVFPWKYHDVIKNLPAEYEYLEF